MAGGYPALSPLPPLSAGCFSKAIGSTPRSDLAAEVLTVVDEGGVSCPAEGVPKATEGGRGDGAAAQGGKYKYAGTRHDPMGIGRRWPATAYIDTNDHRYTLEQLERFQAIFPPKSHLRKPKPKVEFDFSQPMEMSYGPSARREGPHPRFVGLPTPPPPDTTCVQPPLFLFVSRCCLWSCL